jgi:hypothetical protein
MILNLKPCGRSRRIRRRVTFRPAFNPAQRYRLREGSVGGSSRYSDNIAAQYYETDHDVGYVVLDADTSAADSQRVLADNCAPADCP